MIPKIILVDNNLNYLQCLVSINISENIATVIGEFSDTNEFIGQLPDLHPDMVLMDIDIPDMNGIKASIMAMKLIPDLKIIAISMCEEEEYYSNLIELGFKGFLMKSSSINQLEKAIQDVIVGKLYFSV